MTTKQEQKLAELLAMQCIQVASKICSDASDENLSFFPVVLMAGFRPAGEAEPIGDEPAMNLRMAILDVRAPGILPQEAIIYMLDEALKAGRTEAPAKEAAQ